MTKDEAQKLINKKEQQATALLVEAEKIAQEYGIYFDSMRKAAESYWNSSDC